MTTSAEAAQRMRLAVLKALLCAAVDLIAYVLAYVGMRSVGLGSFWPEIAVAALIALVFALLFAERRPAPAAISFALLFFLNLAATAWTGITFYL